VRFLFFKIPENVGQTPLKEVCFVYSFLPKANYLFIPDKLNGLNIIHASSENKNNFVCNVLHGLRVIAEIRNMKILCVILGMISICFLSCKKDSTKTLETYNGDGFIYTDGSLFSGGVGWYFAESRVGQWKAFPIEEAELSAEFKNITVADSIAVTVSLRQTKLPVGCDCVPGTVYFYDVISIRKR